jgi:rhodanese-related sulfurtransferase
MGLFDLFKSNGTKEEKLRTIVNDNAFLVDVRSPAEFKSGSAKGAVNIPLDKISSSIKKFKGKENIVVFCRSGNRSGQAKSILEQNGVEGVTNGGTWNKVNGLINKN